MPSTLLIAGLHGRHSVRVPLDQRCLILVGPNGSGKSTAINTVFFLLTAQWKKLSSLPFSELQVSFGKDTYSLTRDEIEAASSDEPKGRAVENYTRRLREERQLDLFVSKERYTASEKMALSRTLRIPTSELSSFRNYLLRNMSAADFLPAITKLEERLRVESAEHVLFLPTYRRIERELQVIMPHISSRAAQPGEAPPTRESSFAESVGFGMADVQKLIAERSIQLRDVARRQLGDLSISMMKELLANRAGRSTTLPERIDPGEVVRMLENFKPNALTASEKESLTTQIDALKLKKKGKGRQERSREFLRSFVEHIHDISKNIRESERQFLALVELLEEYLGPQKSVRYDSQSFSFKIYDEVGTVIELDQLSSGEKQLVSLFTLLRLSRSKKFRLIVDEPELSLSIQWQKRLLPDILESEMCESIIAATHSPSIFDNYLDSNAVDIRQLYE